MAMQTPQKRSSSNVFDISPLAKKHPKFKSLAHILRTTTGANAHVQFQQMVSGLQKKPELVQIVFGKYMEAVTAEAVQGEWSASGLIVPHPKHILSLPDEFVMQFIIKKSDIPSARARRRPAA